MLTFDTPLDRADELNYGIGGRRLAGYRRAFESADVPFGPDRLLPTPVSIRGGEGSFEAAWARGLRPTALLAVSDIVAIGALAAARRRGVRVPDELEIIGFDDIPLAAMTQPPLSTVRQPISEKGRVATRLLIRELDRGGPPERIVLETELVLRGSTSEGMLRTGPAAGAKGGLNRVGRRTFGRAAAR